MEKTVLAIGFLMLVGTLYNLQAPTKVDFTQKFNDFKMRYNKEYTQTEEQYRLQVYQANMEEAAMKNARQTDTIFGETKFSDLTDEEFAAIYLTLKIENEESDLPVHKFSGAKATPIDWRSRGAVTDVKNQGACGSCWTFGTTGVLEGYFKITTGVLPNLSEQQLLDCSTWQDMNFGCNGGMPSRAMNYVQRKGITTEDAYPYEAVQGSSCKISGGPYHINGPKTIEANEDAFLEVLSSMPVSVAVDATNWKTYKDGIFKAKECDSSLNHAVLAVGFNSEFYIVKNSWGTDWGNKGYIHVEAGKNACGILNALAIPV